MIAVKAIPHKVRLFTRAVRLEESIFTLPFAYLGMVLAAKGVPSGHALLWATLAMVGARTLGMSSNRIIDRHLDALNPRTAGRELPAGRLQLWEMQLLAVGALALFLLSAAMLNPLALALSPLAAAFVAFYPYAKRFTWLTHFFLGFSGAMAPAGGWIAVSGSLSLQPVLLSFAVATWMAGFDMLYHTQDYQFYRQQGLHSFAQRFGVPAALRWSIFLHLLTSLSVLALGIWMDLSYPYYLGWLIATGLLVYEHRLVSPEDLSRMRVAFFNVNGSVGIVLFAFTLLSLY